MSDKLKPCPTLHEGARIIYKYNQPYGIRDWTGFLFFFVKVNKYPDQEERYRKEIEDQFKLADCLLRVLKTRKEAKGEQNNDQSLGYT